MAKIGGFVLNFIWKRQRYKHKDYDSSETCFLSCTRKSKLKLRRTMWEKKKWSKLYWIRYERLHWSLVTFTTLLFPSTWIKKKNSSRIINEQKFQVTSETTSSVMQQHKIKFSPSFAFMAKHYKTCCLLMNFWHHLLRNR